MYSKFDHLDITIDSSIKNITPTARMYLSEAIENGIMLSENPTASIIIYEDRIDFGLCMNPHMDLMHGTYFPNFFEENGNIVYHFAGDANCATKDHTIDYTGGDIHATPDGTRIFNAISSICA